MDFPSLFLLNRFYFAFLSGFLYHAYQLLWHFGNVIWKYLFQLCYIMVIVTLTMKIETSVVKLMWRHLLGKCLMHLSALLQFPLIDVSFVHIRNLPSLLTLNH